MRDIIILDSYVMPEETHPKTFKYITIKGTNIF